MSAVSSGRRTGSVSRWCTPRSAGCSPATWRPTRPRSPAGPRAVNAAARSTGPPRIERPVTDIAVNLSGSGDHWLLAITRARPVGADIEVPRDLDTGQLARACLTPQEQQDLGREPGAVRQRMFFYRCWTRRKEAVLKACGIGLPGSMRGLEAVPGRIGPVENTSLLPGEPDLTAGSCRTWAGPRVPPWRPHGSAPWRSRPRERGRSGSARRARSRARPVASRARPGGPSGKHASPEVPQPDRRKTARSRPTPDR